MQWCLFINVQLPVLSLLRTLLILLTDFLVFPFQFFQKGGVKEALSERELFNAVSGLNISADNEADFLAEIEALEKMNEDHVQKNGRKAAAFLKDDGDPPVLYYEQH